MRPLHLILGSRVDDGSLHFAWERQTNPTSTYLIQFINAPLKTDEHRSSQSQQLTHTNRTEHR